MSPVVQELLDAHRKGKISRRDFIQRAAVALGGTVISGAVLSQLSEGTPATALTTTPTPRPGTTGTPAPAVEITTESITFKTAGEDAPGYLAYPADASADKVYPGVVVVQEWWGLDAHIKSVADLFARNGYVALAPDLYRGEVAQEPDEARKLVMGLLFTDAVADVQGAADHLVGLENVAPKSVGVIGFCYGGRIALEMAQSKSENVGAVASFYGSGWQPTDETFQAIDVPVLSLYGATDGGIPVERVREWEAKYKEFDKINETVVYNGAGHAFFNDTRPSYNPEAAADSLQRTLAWFDQYLVEPQSATATATP